MAAQSVLWGDDCCGDEGSRGAEPTLQGGPMIRIAARLTGRAYLPEAFAYADYFDGSNGVKVDVIAPGQVISTREYDYEIRYPGLDVGATPSNIGLIHEYSSLSTGALPGLRNRLKRWLNRTPQLRIFLSETVREEFGFHDSVPSICRGMGVDRAFYEVEYPETRTYDLVYCGTINASRDITALLESVRRSPLSILLIGHVQEQVHRQYQSCPNITFAGTLSRAEIPEAIVTARYAVNLTPDRYPYNRQQSTKVLEYCAAGLPLLTNRYAWIDEFERSEGASFMTLPHHLDAGFLSELWDYPFRVPRVEHYEWGKVIRRSGLEQALKRLSTGGNG